MDWNDYFHLGVPMRLEAKREDIKNIKDLMGGQRSKRVPSYHWIRDMFQGSYNPDDLDYTDYDEMLKDPQIKAAERLIIYSLLSRKFNVTPASEDPEDVEIADFVRENLTNLRTPFRQVRKDLYSAIPYGFSVSEVNYKYKEDQGRITIDTIRPIHISTIFHDCFDYDEYGDVIQVNQDIGTEVIPIPAEKCIIFAFDETFGNKYGKSILQSCYDNHFMKHQILIWAAVFLEKHEGPTIVGYESEVTASNADEMQSNIDSIHEGTAGFVGKAGEKYEILESQHRGEAFMQFINYHDTMIFRAFMIGSLLLGQSEAKGGSYAQSQTHADTLNIFLDGVHMDLTSSIQEMIRTLVDLNFITDRYPKFEFELFTKKDLLGLLSALQPLADKFMIDPSSEWFHQLLKRIMEEYADIEVSDEIMPGNQAFLTEEEEEFIEEEGEELAERNEEMLIGIGEIMNPTTPE